MSNWKVSKEIIEIFEHKNAQSLSIGKIGTNQVVVQKGLYNGGEEVVFAPEKSVLTGILEQEWKTWLTGPDKNRVKGIALRGEPSCGIIIPNEIIKQITGKDISELPTGEDLSELLGITKYVPLLPAQLAGTSMPIPEDAETFKIKHDVEQFGIYASEFIPGERVVITEKVHGSQGVYYIKFFPDGRMVKWVSTKRFSANFCLKENPDNGYWQAAANIDTERQLDLWKVIEREYATPWKEEVVVQVFGEVVPAQGANWTYGKMSSSLILFKLMLNGESVPYDKVSGNELRSHWVTVLYDGPYENVEELKKLCKGKETISGNQLHIKEGIVIAPYEERRAKDGTRLSVKVLNPEYKETGEEIN